MSDAERALLGCLLDGFRDVPLLQSQVCGDDFDEIRHAEIWEAVVELHSQGQPIDRVTVRTELLRRSSWWTRGAELLLDLRAPATPESALWYAEQVREESITRAVRQQGLRMQQLADDSALTAGERLDKAREWITALDDRRSASTVSQLDALGMLLDSVQTGIPYLATPWKALNKIITGMRPGQLWIVGARPGVGKTLFAENFGTHVGLQGKPVLLVTLEMSAAEITARTVSQLSSIDLSLIIDGRLDDWQDQKVSGVGGRLMSSALRICDRPNMTVEDVRSEAWVARQAAKREGKDLELVVVDYIGLLRVNGRHDTRAIALGHVSRSLKMLARELQVPVLALSQLNRGITSRGMDARPTMADLRESGNLEQDADGVILMHAVQDRDPTDDSVYFTGEVEMIVDKNRNGPDKMVASVQRQGRYARLQELTKP